MNHSDTWHKICDYYYDNIHWAIETKCMGIETWLKKEHGAVFNAAISEFIFDDDKKKSWFILRWS